MARRYHSPVGWKPTPVVWSPGQWGWGEQAGTEWLCGVSPGIWWEHLRDPLSRGEQSQLGQSGTSPGAGRPVEAPRCPAPLLGCFHADRLWDKPVLTADIISEPPCPRQASKKLPSLG